MVFAGFQKLTLLDFPGRMACILFTKGCNMRCPFCHNGSLVRADGVEEYTEEEILEYLKKRQGILEGVVISGGEPLLHNGLGDFLKKVKDLGYGVKLDTNGSFPQKLKALVAEGLVDYVAMDIKNSPEKYSLTAGVDVDMDAIRESIEFLMSGAVNYEFRTTVVKELHTIEDIENAAKWIKGAKRYYLQNFVDSGDILGGNHNPWDEIVVENMKKIAENYVLKAETRGV